MVWSIKSNEEEGAILEIMNTGSSRIVAVVGAAILDQRLEHSLTCRLRRGVTVGKLFKPNGALGTFTAKIDLGYVLHMYEKDEYHGLTGIAEIRNLFAHRLDMSFEAKPVQGAIAKLVLHKRYRYYPAALWDGDTEFEIEEPKDHRTVFITNLRILLALLTRDILRHRPWSNEPTNVTFSPPTLVAF